MNASPTQDTSLYELALGASTLSIPLQVSPATLKSMISSIVDVLIEHQVPVMLWAKLPKGAIWRHEITRYSESLNLPTEIYLFTNPGDDLADEMGSESLQLKNGSDLLTPTTEDLVTPWASATPYHPPAHPGTPTQESARSGAAPEAGTIAGTELGLTELHDSALTSIALASESQLKREYFLLALSPQFSGLIVAHRPRSVRSPKPDTSPHPSAGVGSSADVVEEDALERKHPLLALCAFDRQTILSVLTGVQQAVGFNQAKTLQGSDRDLAINWEQLTHQCQTYTPDLALLTHLFSKQLQRQEEVWHRSVTYRKQADLAETLQAQNEALQEAIQQKDDFLKNVGQELRTPLTNMKTALTLLNSPQIKPTQRQRYMQLLSTECDRQSSLITSLLDLVQLEHAADSTPMQPIQLAEVVPGVVSTYQPLAQEKGVMLAYTIPEDLPPVSCLGSWLKQIAINLIHNGIKFTPTGGQVWVRAKQQGEYVQLEFRDTGIGIATHELTKIFDRFYRVRHPEDYGGAGLGLTVVQQILLHCSGSISVKSKLGEGATFNVLLPIYRSGADG